MPLIPASSLASSGVPEARDGPSSGAPVRILRDDPVPRASCPHCGGALEVATVGSRWQIRHPWQVADRLIVQLGGLDREELHVLLLNTKCIVLCQERVYQGNVAASVVRIGEIFREAVRRTASGLVLVHNHPSGDPTPSPDDVRLTVEAVAAGRLLDVGVLDHVIVAGTAYVSLRERGIAFDVMARSKAEARR
jgi:DNA repair protein RadC